MTAIYQSNQNNSDASDALASPVVEAAETAVPTAGLTDVPTNSPPTSSPVAAVSPTFTSAAVEVKEVAFFGTATATPEPRKSGKYWAEWPLLPPDISSKAVEIYQRGIQLGNDPHAFSTIGDCQSDPSVFMGVYDSDRYVLGDGYQYLEDTIRQFSGSFGRQSITVRDGQSVASVFSPAWADPALCDSGETPIDCEFRIHKPSIVFINLGTNWNGGNEVTHAEYLRKIVESAIEHGVVPILSSKGDNLEGDHRLNRATAQVAYDYDLPFWNFWRSIRDLPGKGIDGTRSDGYLTVEAWGRRSFTGLQALDAVWKKISNSIYY